VLTPEIIDRLVLGNPEEAVMEGVLVARAQFDSELAAFLRLRSIWDPFDCFVASGPRARDSRSDSSSYSALGLFSSRAMYRGNS